jgi:hypothetical protein
MATNFVPKIPKNYECKLCDYVSCNKNDYNIHLMTLSHQSATNQQQPATNFVPKIPTTYECKLCDYVSCNKKDYNKHLITRKHKLATNSNSIYIEKTSYICENCNKEYQDRTGLWRHKKSCLNHRVQYTPSEMDKNNMNNITNEFQLDKELLIKMLLKNQDVMEKLAEVVPMMIELMPKIGNQSNNNNNTNSNNNFNIQMFLNEHCKNAMNLSDFIDSLPITAETYDHTIQNGLTKTLTNMITKGLNQLDILERPIHCTDATRKTLYVKEANNWEKDTELLRILLGIRNLARKQRTMINEWKDVNEGWEKDDNIQTKLTTLICHSMTDIENDQKETSKIIRSISKNVYLDNETKQQYLN